MTQAPARELGVAPRTEPVTYAGAGGGRRVLAYLIDLTIVAIAGALGWWLHPVVGVILAVEAALVFLLLQARTGATPGKRLLGQRVVQDGTLKAPGLRRAVVRTAILALAQVSVLAPAVLILRSRQGRGWHDKRAGTGVIDIREAVQPGAAQSPQASRTPSDSPWSPSGITQTWNPGQLPAGQVTGSASSPRRDTWAPPPGYGVVSQVPQVPQVQGPPAQTPAAPARPAPITSAPAPGIDGSAAPARSRPVQPPSEPVSSQPWAASAPEQTLFPGQRVARPSRVAHEPAAPPAPVITLAADDGETFQITGRGLLGRAPRAADDSTSLQLVTLSDPARSMSRTHVAFGLHAGVLWLEDLGSANGTTLRLGSGREVKLVPGQRVLAPTGTMILVGRKTLVVRAG